jgi:hypothetical protein
MGGGGLVLQKFVQTFTASGSWTAPDGLAGPPAVYAWGPSGSSQAGTVGVSSGGAGGGGAFGGEPALGGVSAGTVLTVTIGAAGSGTATTVTGGSVTVQGNAGGNASGLGGGAAGTAGSNTEHEAGGLGGNGINGSSGCGGGGGGSAGSTGAGGTGGSGSAAAPGAGGAAGTGAAGPPSLAGKAGGVGATSTGPAAGNGTVPGSAAGGGSAGSSFAAAGTGAGGQVIIVWQVYAAIPAVHQHRGPSRAYTRGALVATVNQQAAPPPGTVQPRPTLTWPRRAAARALASFTPVTTVNPPPPGTVQPRPTLTWPRRALARALFRQGPGTVPCAQLVNSFEGGTSGTTISPANSGGASGNAFDVVSRTGTGVIQFDNTQAAHGSLSMKVQAATSGDIASCNWSTSLGMLGQLWFREYLYFTANPTANCRVFSYIIGATNCGTVSVNSSGQLIMLSSNSVTMFTFTAAIPLNQWFRIEGTIFNSTTAGQGTLRLYTSPDSVTPAEAHTSAANFNTAGSGNSAVWGIAFSAAVLGPYWIDDIAVSTCGFLGPAFSLAPGQLYRTAARRPPARAITGFTRPTAAAAVPGPPGTVQPRPTLTWPRRGPARAATGFIRPPAAAAAVPGPPGTVQPRPTLTWPRRVLGRALVRFAPPRGANATPAAGGAARPLQADSDRPWLKRRRVKWYRHGPALDSWYGSDLPAGVGSAYEAGRGLAGYGPDDADTAVPGGDSVSAEVPDASGQPDRRIRRRANLGERIRGSNRAGRPVWTRNPVVPAAGGTFDQQRSERLVNSYRLSRPLWRSDSEYPLPVVQRRK